tara:strand:- start:248 stop:1390 length:1143 start_codon:yes stop_codon:yes gene_type:complete
MSILAFIPARGGSKSIPLKNIKMFCGKPLIYWNLLSLQKSSVDKIIVATDSNQIKNIVLSFSFSKVEVYNRNYENATDEASSESVMLEYIESVNMLDSDTFMLVQATSPFTQTNHFNEALELFESFDSVVSCSITKRFFWHENGVTLNYDINKRKRRQDFKGTLIENGAFYINSVKSIKENKNRISGNIGLYKMPEYTSVELDEELDWLIAEKIMYKYIIKNKKSNINNIKIVLSDVDGVLTDAGMYYSENGDEIKKFCVYDGMAFKILQDHGYKVGIITTEDMNLNRRRAKKLNLDYDFHGINDKLTVIKKLCKKENIDINQVAYIGDDINCFELLSNVGIAACPLNAVSEIKNIPGIIHLNKKGGDGVFREFINYLIK